MASAKYTRLTEIINTDDKGIRATYPTSSKTRLLFTKALGQTTKNKDVVICVEMEVISVSGVTPVRYKQKGWRCFNVDDLTFVGTSPNDAFQVSVSGDRPDKWKSK